MEQADIFRSEFLQTLRRLGRDRFRKGREMGFHHARQEIQLAARRHLRMTADELFRQGGPGAEHPADEYRAWPRGLRRKRARSGKGGSRKGSLHPIDEALREHEVVVAKRGPRAFAAMA